MSAPAPPFLGRVILVTACASPIGRALSVKLAAEGANLCLTDPSKSDGGELCQELRAGFPQCQLVFQALDLTDEVGFRKFVAAAAKAMKRLDGVAHCAYHDSHTPRLHEVTRTTFDELRTSNEAAAFSVLQASLLQFLAQDKAKLIPPAGGYSIAVVGKVISATADTSPIYDASSRFIQSLCASVARDYAKDDVRCNVLNVGPLEIPIVDRLLRGDDFSHVLLARPVKAVEVAETIAFLCGPASAYITGAVLPVDGGASSVA